MYYESLQTSETLLKSAFSLCASLVITKKDLNKDTFKFSHIISSSPLGTNFTFKVSAHNINLKTYLSGWLNVVRPNKTETILTWGQKWCTLEGYIFSMHDYPQHPILPRAPVATVDLKFCLEKQSFNRNSTVRKSLVFKPLLPRCMEQGYNITSTHKHDFVLDNFLLTAKTFEDWDKWMKELNEALDFLIDWYKLGFSDNYFSH